MGMKDIEHDDFWHLEHDGWERAARNYERCWTDHTFPFIPPLLQATDVSAGTRLLDLACGPGYVSEQAGSVGANPVGVDFSRHMIQAARRRNPRLDFCEADAHQLPFQSRSFDAVTMNFGVLHLSHPESAFAEIFRVLRPTGRFGFTVWAKPGQNPGNRAMSEAIEEHADTSVELPAGPPYFRFCDVQECLRVTREAEFVPSTLTFTTTLADWTVPSADEQMLFLRLSETRVCERLPCWPANLPSGWRVFGQQLEKLWSHSPLKKAMPFPWRLTSYPWASERALNRRLCQPTDGLKIRLAKGGLS